MNRQTFELLILGSSSASPAFGRNTSGQLLNIAERYFLIDCGEGTQNQLRRYKAKFQSIDHIFISHLHGDHFFGLPGLLSSMHLLGRKQALKIYAPPQLKELIEHINVASETRLSYPIEWMPTSNDGLNLLFADNKVEVFSFPLKHRIFCTGFMFVEKPLLRKVNKFLLEKLEVSFADIMLLKKGHDVINKHGKLIINQDVTIDPLPSRKYAYCSDTIANNDLVNYIRDVDLLYHESTFLEDNSERAKKTFHSTASQAAVIAQKAGAGQLLLGHFSARYSNLDEFLEEARPVFPNCELAIEGKKIKI
jgi:ribonuclease Z